MWGSRMEGRCNANARKAIRPKKRTLEKGADKWVHA